MSTTKARPVAWRYFSDAVRKQMPPPRRGVSFDDSLRAAIAEASADTTNRGKWTQAVIVYFDDGTQRTASVEMCIRPVITAIRWEV